MYRQFTKSNGGLRWLWGWAQQYGMACFGIKPADTSRDIGWVLSTEVASAAFVTMTFGGPALVLYMTELGLNVQRIGTILSAIPLTAVLALLWSHYLARLGVKKVFVFCFGLRKLLMGLIIFAPLVHQWFGANATYYFLVAVMTAFGLCRTAAESAYIPWSREFFADAMRGRLGALAMAVSTVAALGASSLAGYLLSCGQGLERFQVLFALAVFIGAIAVVCSTVIMGGKPMADLQSSSPWVGLRAAMRDRRFRRFLWVLLLGTVIVESSVVFLPLYLRDRYGLSISQIVWLQGGTQFGILAGAVVCGRMADRLGGTGSMRCAFAMMAVLSLVLLGTPHRFAASLMIGGGAYLLIGFCASAWFIGHEQLLFASIIPSGKQIPYLAIYYAVHNLGNALGALGLGWMLSVPQRHGGGDSGPSFVLFFILIAFAAAVAGWGSRKLAATASPARPRR